VTTATLARVQPQSVFAAAAAMPCSACEGRQLRRKFKALEECGDCGHVRAMLDIDEAELHALYQSGYFRGREYADYVGEAETHRRNFRYRMTLLRRWAGDFGPSFEIGCAYGYWLECLTAHGMRCAGVDICMEGITHAREKLGQNARLGDFLTLPLRCGDYASFCLWDTIEHLKHPERFITRIAELLPPGGWLFLSTGDIGSRLARWQGARWRMIHPPTHLHYFTHRSLATLCQRHGLAVRHVRSLPIYRNLRSVLGRLAVLGRGGLQWLAQWGQVWLPDQVHDKLGLWLDLGDIMLVAAQKL
jgi:SAM-dependent methyltransferase